ncbi:MAG: LysR substrate-binding domain-containing protein, partial [Leeuwenhoekiella sp.]
AILQNEVELGFIEGHSKNREIAYHSFLKDEIVLVVSCRHKYFKTDSITLDELKKLPLVLREEGSGTLEIIAEHLGKNNIALNQLNIAMRLGSSESIKSYLQADNSAAFLSIKTIEKELKAGDLGIIDVENLDLTRDFYYIFKQGHQSALSSIFLNFIIHQYNVLL